MRAAHMSNRVIGAVAPFQHLCECCCSLLRARWDFSTGPMLSSHHAGCRAAEGSALRVRIQGLACFASGSCNGRYHLRRHRACDRPGAVCGDTVKAGLCNHWLTRACHIPPVISHCLSSLAACARCHTEAAERVCDVYAALMGRLWLICPDVCCCKALDSVRWFLCREELEGKAKGIDIFHEDWCV